MSIELHPKILAGGRKDPEILVWDVRNPGQLYSSLRRKADTNQGPDVNFWNVICDEDINERQAKIVSSALYDIETR